mmetsp:Transcript_29645/g.81575  ORF Transcript_29645/g.81575 Transcript_29645/m.81575 type:complete len:229 (+) Transcript_29645:310-996(+)
MRLRGGADARDAHEAQGPGAAEHRRGAVRAEHEAAARGMGLPDLALAEDPAGADRHVRRQRRGQQPEARCGPAAAQGHREGTDAGGHERLGKRPGLVRLHALEDGNHGTRLEGGVPALPGAHQGLRAPGRCKQPRCASHQPQEDPQQEPVGGVHGVEEEQRPAGNVEVVLQQRLVQPHVLGPRAREGRAGPPGDQSQEALELGPAVARDVKLQQPLLGYQHADLVDVA